MMHSKDPQTYIASPTLVPSFPHVPTPALYRQKEIALEDRRKPIALPRFDVLISPSQRIARSTPDIIDRDASEHKASHVWLVLRQEQEESKEGTALDISDKQEDAASFLKIKK